MVQTGLSLDLKTKEVRKKMSYDGYEERLGV